MSIIQTEIGGRTPTDIFPDRTYCVRMSDTSDDESVVLPGESAESYVEELMLRYPVPTERYRWAAEEARWGELVYAILARIGAPGVPSERAATARDLLFEMNKLAVRDLAAMEPSGTTSATSHANAVATVLLGVGFSESEARRAVAALAETAENVERHYDGKPQRYLREYGQRMLEELPERFTFDEFAADDVRYAFTLWLQNVLNMPVTLRSPEMSVFCERYDVTVEELVAAADVQDINLALLDDLVAEHVAELEAAELDRESTTPDRGVGTDAEVDERDDDG